MRVGEGDGTQRIAAMADWRPRKLARVMRGSCFAQSARGAAPRRARPLAFGARAGEGRHDSAGMSERESMPRVSRHDLGGFSEGLFAPVQTRSFLIDPDYAFDIYVETVDCRFGSCIRKPDRNLPDSCPLV